MRKCRVSSSTRQLLLQMLEVQVSPGQPPLRPTSYKFGEGGPQPLQIWPFASATHRTQKSPTLKTVVLSGHRQDQSSKETHKTRCGRIRALPLLCGVKSSLPSSLPPHISMHSQTRDLSHIWSFGVRVFSEVSLCRMMTLWP